MMASFYSVIVSIVACWALLSSFISRLSRRLMDQPNARSSHCRPTPRGGGVAFVLLSVLASAFGVFLFIPEKLPLISLPILALPLSVIGFVDDLYNLPSSLRYGIHFLTSTLILSFSPLAQGFSGSQASWSWLPFALVVLIIVISAVINFTNFMDGLDGLVAGCMAVAISALYFCLNVPWTLWFLVGSLIGFLFWNWSPAKVFMGDVGSTFLGAVFAGLVLQASSWLEAFGFLLVITPLLADSCLCVFRRFFAGQRVFQAHRLHLFQRLHQGGWSHARVSLSYIAATTVLAIALLAGGWAWVFFLALLELVIGFWLDQRVAVPFVVASEGCWGTSSPSKY